jgi:osmotically-inducible protein OsmY
MAVKLLCDGVKDKNLVEQKGAAKKTLTDLIVRKRTEIAVLSAISGEGGYLQISAVDGLVTLSGHVNSEAERREALKIARKVKGVSDVADHLKVIEYRTNPQEH